MVRLDDVAAEIQIVWVACSPSTREVGMILARLSFQAPTRDSSLEVTHEQRFWDLARVLSVSDCFGRFCYICHGFW